MSDPDNEWEVWFDADELSDEQLEFRVEIRTLIRDLDVRSITRIGKSAT